MREFPRSLIDTAAGSGLSARYRNGAWRRGVEPNRYFNSRWYALENPDWTHYVSPFDHFLDRGFELDLAPSPFVDVLQLGRYWPNTDPGSRYRRLVREGAPLAGGVHAGVRELVECQHAFLEGVAPVLLSNSVTTPRPNLVLVQNDGSTQLERWAGVADRSFDLLVNHYVERTSPSGRGDIEVSQQGTKFSGVHGLMQAWPAMLAPYRYVLLIDDDITIGTAAIESLFAKADQCDASLAQATLDHASSTAWPDLKLAPDEELTTVRLNTAEVMMPLMRRDFFWRAVRYMSKSISGYGLDAVWGDMLADRGETAVRLPVLARHERPVDQQDGEYYEFLRRHHLNPHGERWMLEAALGLSRGVRKVHPPT